MGRAELIASVRFDPGTSKRLGIVIGSNYVGSKIVHTLRGCENDANLVADALKASGYEVSLLAGADVTHRQIISAFKRANRAAGTNGLVLVYFTGLAYMDAKERCPRLVPHDAELQSLDATAISSEDITQLYLKDVGNTIILLDCCHSGYLPVDDTFQAGRTCVVMAASTLSETSREIEINGNVHGPFTYWLVDHWQNYPAAVDINSLYTSVTQALETSEMSTPVLSGVQTGRLVLRPALTKEELAVKEAETLPTKPTTVVGPIVIIDDKVIGIVRRDLVRMLAKTFTSRTDFNEITIWYLSTALDNIPLPTDAVTLDAIIDSVIAWCISRGGNRLGQLLAGAIEERPDRDDLRQMVESLTE